MGRDPPVFRRPDNTYLVGLTAQYEGVRMCSAGPVVLGPYTGAASGVGVCGENHTFTWCQEMKSVLCLILCSCNF